ncbi:helix-turn-helix transcriptional regulator [Alkaliphilus serpentinus]|uniref:Helix-turn-helix transcriptional regulator n=1 Tax=Alkaliphilus serpentinus TaxID=1482731 RepID=A0A833M717_9FIRM|nr:AraC family transcriptional regulator [Alkaliphilus serpentinus]KAB3529318.1 helix-turn-helix transcriptional regulator [Alkaliphilus serpentinus]
MNKGFQQFINQIPSDIYNSTETHYTADISISRPTTYIINSDIYLQDYHFTLLNTSSPPMKIGKKEYQFSRKRMLVFTPETVIRCTKDTPSGEYIAMSIKKEFLQEIVKEALGKDKPSFLRIDNPFSPNILRLVEAFEWELDNRRSSSQLMLQSISIQMGIQILRESGVDSSLLNKSPSSHRSYITLAKDYMMTYYNANIKLEDICKQIHISPYYFIRMFKSATGQTPYEYLRSIRLQKAEEMLQQGKYSIEEVARLNGFVNVGHFSNVFKRERGVPPSRYKKSYMIISKE